MRPGRADAPYGWQRDERGRVFQVNFDLRKRLYFGAAYTPQKIIENPLQSQRTSIDFKVATLPLHHGLDPDQAEELRSWTIPLPASRTPLEPDGPKRGLVMSVLDERGFVWEDLRVKHLKDVFFSKGERNALFYPENLKHQLAPDDLYPGRMKMSLAFDLPKGAYATLVVKRLTDG